MGINVFDRIKLVGLLTLATVLSIVNISVASDSIENEDLYDVNLSVDNSHSSMLDNHIWLRV